MEGARLRCEAALADGLSVAIACDPSLEGILGAVGIGYLAHADEARVRLVPRDGAQPRLGEGLVEAPADADDQMVNLARRVYRGFGRHVSDGCPKLRGGSCPSGCAGACTRKIVYAAASDDPRTTEAIHRYVRRGFREGGRMRSLIADAQVVEVDELARGVLGECEHTRQFVRFSQLADGSLWAVFRPKADTIPLTASFFARRMGNERFCIVDPVHRNAAFHDSGQLSGHKGYAVIRIDAEGAERLAASHELSPDERYVRALWKRFYDSVALPGRDASQRGYDLRAGWMPKRFWAGLTELDPRSDDAGPVAPERYLGSTKPSLSSSTYA